MNQGKETILKDGKELRTGYTTGSCAAAAAAAATLLLLEKRQVPEVRIILPEGRPAFFETEVLSSRETQNGTEAVCGIKKDGGDDPDITTGLIVYARVRNAGTEERYAPGENKIIIKGGEGVGTVTQPGLACAPGEAAINPVPRKMITENVRDAAKKSGHMGALEVEISVPGGDRVAKSTFNPRLGITGGISILGTTGIVEPMSEAALVETIRLDIDRMYREDPEKILISPGNYGRDFCRDHLGLDIEKAVQVSNYIGEALDHICYKGFEKMLLVGHTGKLVKLAAGVMNTHSRVADARMETIAINAVCCGAGRTEAEKILSCLTTDQAFCVIEEAGLDAEAVGRRLVARAMEHINARIARNGAEGKLKAEIIMFARGREHIIASEGAFEMASDLAAYMEGGEAQEGGASK